jgi:hypothetical protein
MSNIQLDALFGEVVNEIFVVARNCSEWTCVCQSRVLVSAGNSVRSVCAANWTASACQPYLALLGCAIAEPLARSRRCWTEGPEGNRLEPGSRNVKNSYKVKAAMRPLPLPNLRVGSKTRDLR